MNRASGEGQGAVAGMIGRLVVLLVALTAFGGSLVLSRRHDDAAGPSSDRYVCPMHPQVVSSVPGDCPICNMALERARHVDAGETLDAARVIAEEVERRVVTQVVRAPGSLGADGEITAVVYRDIAEKLAPGDQAVFFRGAEPAKAVAVRLTTEPAKPWDASTVQVRFASGEHPSSGEDDGWIEIAARPWDLLVVPVSSVLYASDGAYVLAQAPGGRTFARRHVEVGRNLDSSAVSELGAERTGAVVVLSGLHEGERVVARDTFFLDAERRLQVARIDTEGEVME